MKKTFTFILICFALSAKADYWTQKANFPGTGKVYPFSFSILNKGYIVCGANGSSGGTDGVWEYDPAANTWTQKANYGGGMRYGGCSGFSIGSKGYVGAGFGPGGIAVDDFWEYDPATNTWTQKASFAGGVRIGAISFSTGGFGYIGTGTLGSSGDDLWQYDPAANAWIQKANFSTTTTDANVFVIGNSAYLLGGCPGSYFNFNWEYNTVTNVWTQQADLPATERCDAAAFTLCDKGYWGIGESNGLGYESDLWQYDPLTNQWIQKAAFAGPPRDEPAYFSIGTKGYIGLGGEDGWSTGIVFDDFWEYTPDNPCATGIEEIPNTNLQFTIIPNPASQHTIISWSEGLLMNQSSANKKIEITITNAQGKKVFETQLKTKTLNLKLQTSNFSKGIYFVEINNGIDKAVKKFIKN